MVELPNGHTLSSTANILPDVKRVIYILIGLI